MTFKERFAQEWDEFIGTTGGKMMVLLAALSVLALCPIWALLSLI